MFICSTFSSSRVYDKKNRRNATILNVSKLLFILKAIYLLQEIHISVSIPSTKTYSSIDLKCS